MQDRPRPEASIQVAIVVFHSTVLALLDQAEISRHKQYHMDPEALRWVKDLVADLKLSSKLYEGVANAYKKVSMGR